MQTARRQQSSFTRVGPWFIVVSMKRRDFLRTALAAAAATRATPVWAELQPAPQAGEPAPRVVQTVTGPLAAARLGFTLMHEHVMVDFIGADKTGPDRYNRDEVIRVAAPWLESVARLGCKTFVDCTPAYVGRDVRVLEALARRTGLNIVTTTGYYGAGNPAARFVPRLAWEEPATRLAARWIAEFENGIDGTGIRPGIIKTAVSGAPLSEIDRKLVRAAAITHKATRLAIASHTGSGAAALEQLDILEAERVPASAFIWVHAHSEAEAALHERVAARGAWLEFDSLRPNTVARMIDLVEEMARRGRLGQTLVSSDAGWYHVGEPGGGTFATYDLVFTRFVPELEKRLGKDAVKQVFVRNPARALCP